MKITTKIHSIDNLGITIGNFDGVHKGHQKFLRDIKINCAKRDLAFGVITFVPHPHQILSPQDNYLINTYMERRELLRNIGVDYLYEIEFTRDLSTLDPGLFLDSYVFVDSHIKVFFAGFDFAFGTQKSGNHSFLQKYCDQKKVKLVLCDQVKFQNGSVSSSTVREQIFDGKVGLVREILGRNFFISGVVIRGEGRGKMIGIPTINIQYSKQVIIPPAGVYASLLEHKEIFYPAVTNIGKNPTFGSGRKISIETHVLDFDEIIYGDSVRVHFVEELRAEKIFSSANELVTQIGYDIEQSRRIHSKKC